MIADHNHICVLLSISQCHFCSVFAPVVLSRRVGRSRISWLHWIDCQFLACQMQIGWRWRECMC